MRALLLAVGLGLALAGCEETARHNVKVRPPAEMAPAAAPVLDPLPLDAAMANSISLFPVPSSGAELLARQVEAVFQTGEQEYKAGHLSEARQEFDRALDLLLGSGYDLASESRLEKLFDRIVETVRGYDLIAFREGDVSSEQKAEPAPIDEIAEMTLPVDPRQRESVERELQGLPHDLPLTLNDPVLSFVNFFQTPRGRAIVETGLRRAGRYRAMIERVLREEGLPQDLIYLAQAESAFQPLALSRAGARGIWQFMAYRGRQYGLQHSWWVDDRQDPEKATRAAARHLRDLYQMFGDWYLTLAAYNSGPGHVQHAVERTGYADFWELYKRNVLPRETRNYVPIILALTLIAKEPARYGFQVQPEPPLRPDDRVKPGHPMDLRLVAETIDADLETLKAFNPQLLRLVTPADPDFELHLPEGTAERFTAGIAAIPPEKWVSWRRYRVEEGDTLTSIARKFRLTPAAIAGANHLAAPARLESGNKLIIPAAARPHAAPGHLVRYRVRRGDTLETIADEFDCTPTELKKWNGLRGNRVSRGMRLKIYPAGKTGAPGARARAAGTAAAKPPAHAPARKKQESAAAEKSEKVIHRVQKGETLWSIAHTYRTTIVALRAANQFLGQREPHVGDKLIILLPH